MTRQVEPVRAVRPADDRLFDLVLVTHRAVFDTLSVHVQDALRPDLAEERRRREVLGVTAEVAAESMRRAMTGAVSVSFLPSITAPPATKCEQQALLFADRGPAR